LQTVNDEKEIAQIFITGTGSPYLSLESILDALTLAADQQFHLGSSAAQFTLGDKAFANLSIEPMANARLLAKHTYLWATAFPFDPIDACLNLPRTWEYRRTLQIGMIFPIFILTMERNPIFWCSCFVKAAWIGP
jgi:hypothetical protein